MEINFRFAKPFREAARRKPNPLQRRSAQKCAYLFFAGVKGTSSRRVEGGHLCDGAKVLAETGKFY